MAGKTVRNMSGAVQRYRQDQEVCPVRSSGARIHSPVAPVAGRPRTHHGAQPDPVRLRPVSVQHSVDQIATTTSATVPTDAVTLLSTGSALGASVRSVHSPSPA